jgi:septal ring factor EnvC (AmiA/AmiB activator)
MRGWPGLSAAALVAAVVAVPVAAAGPGEPAGAARLARARAAAVAAPAAEDRVAALADAVEAYEAALEALREEVLAAAQRERGLRLGLVARREEITRLLAALQAVSRTRRAQGLHPLGPLAAARAGSMLASMRPGLQAEADALASSLAEIAAEERKQGQGMSALEDGLAGLDATRSELRQALAAKQPAPVGPDAATAATVRESETLTALAAALVEGEAEGPAGGSPAVRLAWPVAGQVVLGFGERDAAGERRPGMVIAAPPQALVTAPVDGVVRYAGPFLDYGYVVALAPAPGTLVVLAGIAELHARSGARVRRGELLGLLGGRAPDADEYVMLTEAGTGAGAEVTLYVEIRHGTGPVDPEPWFTGEHG